MKSEIKFKSEKDIFEEEEEKAFKVDQATGEFEEEKPRDQIKKVMKRETFDQLKLRCGAMEEKGSSKFYIGTKDKVKGQITFLEEEQKQKFVLARIIRKEDFETGKTFFTAKYFTDPISQRERGRVCDTIEGEFYLYKLITKEKTYQLFSTEKLGLGEYHVWGTIIEILDHVDMGNEAKIGKRLPLLFVHTAHPQENQIQNHKEFFERFKEYNLTEEKFINWLYTSPQGWVYEFPRSFSHIQIANILGCSDDFNTFHLPVFMISETGTGKTTATEFIFKRMNEAQAYMDMTNSTLKGVIPSFKSATSPKPGLFLESVRYVPIDEFLPGVSNLHQEEKGEVMESIKNILDYKERSYMSGHGKIKGVMKAEHLALSNPKNYANTILQFSKHFFPENLTRYLIWYIPSSQKQFIKERIGKLKRGDYSLISKQDFLEGVDYLKTFNCEYDVEKVKEIYEIGENFLKSKGNECENLRAMYSSRYLVHCCRLLDALTKFRCWVEGDQKFKATQKDYDLVKKLWLEMLENWGIDFLQVNYERAKSGL